MRIQNFIWDFDGMLFDTYPHTEAAFLEHCRRVGRTADPAEVHDLFKINLRAGFARYGLTDAEIRAFYEIENDISFPPQGKPYPWIPDLLRRITERGSANYLYTHRSGVALAYLDLYALTPLFAGFVTGDDGFPFKPAPDALNHIAARFGLPKDACLMLGDRDIDIGAGLNAGMHTLLYDDENRYPDGVGEEIRCETGDELSRAVLGLL